MSLSGFPRFLHAFPRTDYVTATKPPSQAARDVSRDARTASRRWGPLVTDKDFALAVLDKMFQLNEWIRIDPVRPFGPPWPALQTRSEWLARMDLIFAVAYSMACDTYFGQRPLFELVKHHVCASLPLFYESGLDAAE